jgi:putative membrane protein
MVRPLFSSQDLLAIQETVKAAERRTRGEIVPMVVAASARYRETAHLLGLLALFIALGGILWRGTQLQQVQWGGLSPGWFVLVLALAYVIGATLGRSPVVIRSLTPDSRMAMKVRLRAEQAFYQKGLHQTRGGTGILIFLSLLERGVVILADHAINEQVPPDTWKTLTDQLVVGIRSGEATAAFCAAITACGAILAEHFPVQNSHDPNELRDELIQDS